MTTDNIETRVAILEKEVVQQSGLFGRLDTAIEKLTDVSNSINQLLVVHELKITQHEVKHSDFYDELDKLRSEHSQAHISIQDKMTTMQNSVKEDLDKLEKKIFEEIGNISKQIKNLEKWRWIVIGGSIAIMYIIQATGGFGLFKLFQ